MPALARLDQATGLPVRRAPTNSNVHGAPGDMVHMDIKKLGHIPDGGGWCKLGLGNDKTKGHSGAGYAWLHHVVDDCSRLAYSEILGDEKRTLWWRFGTGPGTSSPTTESALRG